MDACYCKCITYKLGRIHLLKPSACVRVRGADAAGSLQDCFTAPGVIKSGYEEFFGTAQSALNSYGIQRLTSRAKECGLPASTVKLSPPALDTCEGASILSEIWYSPREASLSRYLHSCVCVCVRVRARAVVDMHACS